MLHWSIPLVAAPAILAILATTNPVRRALVAIARVLFRIVNRLGAWTAVALDFVLAPNDRDGKPPVWRLIFWVGLNTSAVAASYALRTSHGIHSALGAASALVALHVMLITASILVIAEENRIMHHGEPKSGAMFSPHTAVRDFNVILLEIALVLACSAALIDMLARLLPGAILTKTPETISSFTSHLLCLLAALPGASGLVAMTEFADQIAFGGHIGGAVRGAIYLLGSALIYGAIAAWIYQRSAVGMILSRLDEAHGDEAHFLQLVLSRAPQHVKADLLALALDSGKTLAQPRAINIMRHLRVWTFPQTFLHNLGRLERSVKTLGLNQIRAFLAESGDELEDELVLTGARKAFERYAELSLTVEDTREDGVVSRLGAVIAAYMAIIQSRNLRLNTTRKQHSAMLEIAKLHKSGDVRLTMAELLLERRPNGFLRNYLVNMHERPLDDVDIEIIQKLAGYFRGRQTAIAAGERDTVLKRLNWNIRHAGLDTSTTSALRSLQEALNS